MLENSISHNKIENSTVTQTINNTNILVMGDNLPLELVRALKQKYPSEFESNKDEEIKNKIVNLYKQAIEIVNNEESFYYISKKDARKLRKIYQELETLDFFYKEYDNIEEKEQYYHNLFVILMKLNGEELIERYKTLPKEIQEKYEIRYLYAEELINFKDKIENAESILYDLYYNKNYEFAFPALVRCYYLQQKYVNVVEILSKAKKEQFDRYGFLASNFIISKNFIKPFKESELLRYNNGRFKNMPLFYAASANIMYVLNHKSKKVKEQFKKSFKYINEKDITVIGILCDIAKILEFENEMIEFLLTIKLTPYLKLRLIELLQNQHTLEKEKLSKLKELSSEFDEEELDVDYVDGIILELQGENLKAIEKFEQSYKKKENLNAVYKYIQLSIINNTPINENLLKKTSMSDNLSIVAITVEGYKHKGDYINAIQNAYKALYLLNGNEKNKNIIKLFWGCTLLGGNTIYKKTNVVCPNAAVTLKNVESNERRNIIIEDDTSYEEGRLILGASIIRSVSALGLELITKKVGDDIVYKNEKYIIEEIKDKYTFLSHICFEIVKDEKGIEVFYSNSEDIIDFVEQLKEKLIDIQKNADKQLDIYEETKNVPLSFFFGIEKNAEDYFKIIYTLLSDPKRYFYAGEPIEISKEEEAVIDLTSIIVLALIGKLDVFTEELCQKIYITTSLKNKVKYYYESLLRKNNEKEMTIGVIRKEDGTSTLAMDEIEVSKKIELWTNIYKCINRFQEENIEAPNDDILNMGKRDIWDKVQFDLIELAKQKNISYVCDDLVMRKIAGGIYKVKHTNCIALLEYSYLDDTEQYIDDIIKLAKGNYVYTIYNGKYIGKIFLHLYNNFDEKNNQKIQTLLNELLKDKKGFNLYIGILINMINNLKRIEYIKLYDKIYLNKKVNNIIEFIINNIKDACDKLNIEYGQYEKYITKEIVGIEL